MANPEYEKWRQGQGAAYSEDVAQMMWDATHQAQPEPQGSIAEKFPGTNVVEKPTLEPTKAWTPTIGGQAIIGMPEKVPQPEPRQEELRSKLARARAADALVAQTTGKPSSENEDRVYREMQSGGTTEHSRVAAYKATKGYLPGQGGGVAYVPPTPTLDPAHFRQRLMESGIRDSELLDKMEESYKQSPIQGMEDALEMSQVQGKLNEGDINQDLLNAQQGLAAQVPPAIAEAQKAIQDAEAQRRKERAEADKAYKEQLAHYDAEIEDLHSTHINPERYFETGQGNRAISAIAVGLGEFANQVTGHGNAALKIVQDAVNNDIEAQKADVNAKYMSLGLRGNLVNRFHDRFGDIDQAAEAAKSSMYQNLALYTEYLGAQDGSAKAVAAAKQQAEALRALGDQAKQAFDLRAQTRAELRARAMSGGGGMSSADAEWLAEGDAPKQTQDGIWTDLPDGIAERVVDYERVNPETGNREVVHGIVHNKTFVKDVQNTLDTTQDMDDLVSIIRKGNQKGWNFLTDIEREDVKTGIQQLKNRTISLWQNGMGKQTTPSEIENQFGDPNDFDNHSFTTNAAKVQKRLDGIQRLANVFRRDAERKLDPGKIEWQVDPDRKTATQRLHLPNARVVRPFEEQKGDKTPKRKGNVAVAPRGRDVEAHPAPKTTEYSED